MGIQVSDFLLSGTASSQTDTGWDFLFWKSARRDFERKKKQLWVFRILAGNLVRVQHEQRLGDLDDNDVQVAVAD